MTLKDELETLRGEPIAVFAGDSRAIPCIETSDSERLCKHPIVSVQMITYNHEPYIRQAIEGVMMQKTDFEFELIIGEDCSQDKTREICFEYQKKYPDKIRVLWWHENVSKLGGNGRRTRAHCRGEFIAYCEGDDFWTDPLKLQKQVDAMRRHPNCGICFCRANYHDETGERPDRQWGIDLPIEPGVIEGIKFFRLHAYGADASGSCGDIGFLMTATVMVRQSVMQKINAEYDIFNWRLSLGDTTLWLGLSAFSDAYYLPDFVSVYRQNQGGACKQNAAQICIDAQLARLYWCDVLKIHEFRPISYQIIFSIRFNRSLREGQGGLLDIISDVEQIIPISQWRCGMMRRIVIYLLRIGLLPERMMFVAYRIRQRRHN